MRKSFHQKIPICSMACNEVRKKGMPKKISSLSVLYYTKQGMSAKTAKKIISEKQRKRSNRCIEYWINKGFDLSAAQNQVSLIQKTHNEAKGPEYNHREKSVRCVEYWIGKGLSPEKARQKVSEIQTLATLEAFVNRYGEEEGRERYEIRNKKCSESSSLSSYIDRHGEEKGTELYLKKFEKFDTHTSQYASDFSNILEEYLSLNGICDAHFKPKFNKEYGFRIGERYAFYDFVVPSIKKAIEINGKFHHADPLEWSANDIIIMNGKERLVSDIWEWDKIKINAIQNRGFETLIIWHRNRKDFKDNIELAKQFLI